MASESGIGVVVLGAASERSKMEPLRHELSGVTGVHFALLDRIDEACMMIHDAEVFVGGDSGPLHLATLFGIPVVGLYGPASPALTAPRSAMALYLFHALECSPCSQRLCVRPDDPCMHHISEEEVHAAIATRLDLNVVKPRTVYG
jgi:ADP-heptose:LPS heptosyltransferase